MAERSDGEKIDPHFEFPEHPTWVLQCLKMKSILRFDKKRRTGHGICCQMKLKDRNPMQASVRRPINFPRPLSRTGQIGHATPAILSIQKIQAR